MSNIKEGDTIRDGIVEQLSKIKHLSHMQKFQAKMAKPPQGETVDERKERLQGFALTEAMIAQDKIDRVYNKVNALEEAFTDLDKDFRQADTAIRCDLVTNTRMKAALMTINLEFDERIKVRLETFIEEMKDDFEQMVRKDEFNRRMHDKIGHGDMERVKDKLWTLQTRIEEEASSIKAIMKSEFTSELSLKASQRDLEHLDQRKADMGMMKETTERLNRVEALVHQLQESAFSRDSSSEAGSQDIEGSDSEGMNEDEKTQIREEKMEHVGELYGSKETNNQNPNRYGQPIDEDSKGLGSISNSQQNSKKDLMTTDDHKTKTPEENATRPEIDVKVTQNPEINIQEGKNERSGGGSILDERGSVFDGNVTTKSSVSGFSKATLSKSTRKRRKKNKQSDLEATLMNTLNDLLVKISENKLRIDTVESKMLDAVEERIQMLENQSEEDKAKLYETVTGDLNHVKGRLQEFEKMNFRLNHEILAKPFKYIDNVRSELKKEQIAIRKKMGENHEKCMSRFVKVNLEIQDIVSPNQPPDKLNKVELEKMSIQIRNTKERQQIDSKKLNQNQIDMAQAFQKEFEDIRDDFVEFKDPIMNELKNVRKENECLLRELSRHQNLYRNMLTDYYQMLDDKKQTDLTILPDLKSLHQMANQSPTSVNGQSTLNLDRTPNNRSLMSQTSQTLASKGFDFKRAVKSIQHAEEKQLSILKNYMTDVKKDSKITKKMRNISLSASKTPTLGFGKNKPKLNHTFAGAAHDRKAKSTVRQYGSIDHDIAYNKNSTLQAPRPFDRNATDVNHFQNTNLSNMTSGFSINNIKQSPNQFNKTVGSVAASSRGNSVSGSFQLGNTYKEKITETGVVDYAEQFRAEDKQRQKREGRFPDIVRQSEELQAPSDPSYTPQGINLTIDNTQYQPSSQGGDSPTSKQPATPIKHAAKHKTTSRQKSSERGKKKFSKPTSIKLKKFN